MQYQITVRHGGTRHRYHTFLVEGDDASEALRLAADGIPSVIASEVDLVELRVAVDPERRAYLDEDSGPS